jgi:predicted nucleic acid-binding Zn ribbon protein
MRRAGRLKTFASIEQTLLRSSHPVVREALRRQEALTPLNTVWKRSVAEPLRRHARPVTLAEGTLSVHAESPVWASLLRNSEQSIVSTLRSSGLSEVRRLRVRVAPPSASRARPAANERGEEDPDIKRLFARLRKALG